ncbi:hypothetical protein Ae406Ps2_6364 [Pseudonocardia sp. Ae406_Ps2]|uniref:XRE family transcriptional regulator n=2 Tax=Pseudonocardia TaxID=1847 RepID=UPI000963295B|nr:MULTISPECIES: XRE family transcriptional regulator [unclassified Pseudonocardia]OLL69941.1 hypothetical protein Ae168Ps1_6419c [Pseudonocardia sp. Ae168_Ps1]OLL69994.1 hypothetical protein Ae263Ps1_6386c [Pseudonocardia sp. Ae263_Ps1]OLL89014.1 hypothetical protein Ae356Ps1_6341 [Pseudonocardia sp. Ae356_Ps1]OLL89467.1 hypothetical protein Ae331Ps2_6287 [Pseudonocardia sp. Ae331_Ps2]OLL89924.1 hypothetical protein Ae406Ps2_6364 [Pseudonocardia sp. Ae406_Ps2]
MDELPAWASRIRAERNARRWSQRDLARAMSAHAEVPTDDEPGRKLDIENVRRRLIDWEKGRNAPDRYHQALIARSFNTVTAAFFPEQERARREAELAESHGQDTFTIVQRLQRSDIDGATLDALRITIDQLCCDYATVPSRQLVDQGHRWLHHVSGMLAGSLTLSQHREAMVLAGWLALLVGCVEWDMGRAADAEKTRRAALSLAREAENAELAGWAHEMKAWFALTGGDFRGVIAAAKEGAELAPSHGVAVQLSAQEAKAWARMGDRRQVELALERGRQQLERLPYPNDVTNHFVVDPAKYDFYVMDAYRILGENELAKTYADEVLRAGTDFSGRETSTMRNAEARITLGVVAAREGDLETALSYGNQAIDSDRQSVPSLLMVSSELDAVVAERFPAEPDAQEYRQRLMQLR